MSDMSVVVEHVNVSLGEGEGLVHVIKDVSLSVRKNEALGLVGASGSGKSTLLMMIAGLERPDNGMILVDGVNIGVLDEDALAHFRGSRIGVVFQSFHLIPTMTALENVALPLELSANSHSSSKSAFERAKADLEAVGLGARLNHYPSQLSGGEQQRVAVARAIVARPALLIADEPTGNLDEASGKAVTELLFSLKRELGITLLLVTHDAALASQCDRVITLRSGRIDASLRQA